MGVQSANSFVDRSFGDKGYGIWIAVVVGCGALVQSYYVISGLLRFYPNVKAIIIYGIPLLILLAIFSLTMLIGYQGMHTAQRIKIEGDGTFTVRYYFGRTKNYEVTSVKEIGKHKVKYLKHFITPLGRGGANHKVVLENDYFYLNNLMSESPRFIKWLEEKSGLEEM